MCDPVDRLLPSMGQVEQEMFQLKRLKNGRIKWQEYLARITDKEEDYTKTIIKPTSVKRWAFSCLNP